MIRRTALPVVVVLFHIRPRDRMGEHQVENEQRRQEVECDAARPEGNERAGILDDRPHHADAVKLGSAACRLRRNLRRHPGDGRTGAGEVLEDSGERLRLRGGHLRVAGGDQRDHGIGQRRRRAPDAFGKTLALHADNQGLDAISLRGEILHPPVERLLADADRPHFLQRLFAVHGGGIRLLARIADLRDQSSELAADALQRIGDAAIAGHAGYPAATALGRGEASVTVGRRLEIGHEPFGKPRVPAGILQRQLKGRNGFCHVQFESGVAGHCGHVQPGAERNQERPAEGGDRHRQHAAADGGHRGRDPHRHVPEQVDPRRDADRKHPRRGGVHEA